MNFQSLFVAIMNRGKAEAVLNEMRGFGLTGGVVLLGEGTAGNRLLKILGLDETQKEIILLPPIEERYEAAIHEMLLECFQIDKKRSGIAFSMPLSYLGKTALLKENKQFDPTHFEYQSVFVIVNEGSGKEVMNYAQQVGQYGGTIIHGHGAGIPTDAYFPFNIEPQKDIVFLLVKRKVVNQLIEHLTECLELQKPGKGILFSMPVSRVTGLSS